MDAAAPASWLALWRAGGQQVRPAPLVDRKCLSERGRLRWLASAVYVKEGPLVRCRVLPSLAKTGS